MRTPAEKPGIDIVQKNGSKAIITDLLKAAIQLLDDGERYDLKIVLNRKVKAERPIGHRPTE